MTLRLYNTLTRKKEAFVPLVDNKVSMYVCGITAYDVPHLGHARAYVCFDVLYRYLQAKGFDITYIRNITDIDDKIINRAGQEYPHLSPEAACEKIVDTYYGVFQESMHALNTLPPTHEPKATEHIEDIITIIQQLIDKGLAYQAGQDVFFDVTAFSDYGKLSSRKIDEMLSGARVEVNTNKRNPLDFALWKGYKHGEPAWKSPWGNGRPGWHIECSAMSVSFLGPTFDIHGGGQDLIFPHHENEIAQTQGATGKPFARYWIHNGFLTINKEKMSKSLGNFFSLPDVFAQYEARVVRMYLLSKQYRSPIDFSDKELQDTKEALSRLENCLGRFIATANTQNISLGALDHLELDPVVEEAMDDDLNTPQAIGTIFTSVTQLNHDLEKNQISSESLRNYTRIVGTCNLLGIEFHPSCPQEIATGNDISYNETNKAKATILLSQKILDDENIIFLLALRRSARSSKAFAFADEIRSSLDQKGIEIRDTKDTTEWIRRNP